MAVADGVAASIGKSVEIRGEVKGSEDLLIDGRVEGTVTLTDSKLTIGPSARVDADVSARDVVILGVLNGNVTASVRVDLRKGGNLTGRHRENPSARNPDWRCRCRLISFVLGRHPFRFHAADECALGSFS